MCGRRFVIRGIKIPVEVADSIQDDIYYHWVLNPYSWPHPTHVYFGYYTDDKDRSKDEMCRFFALLAKLGTIEIKTYYGIKV